MIGTIDVAVQAHNPEMPLYPMKAFAGSPSSIRVRNVPRQIGSWKLTSVTFSVVYPDGETKMVSCIPVNNVWVGTIAGSETVGTTENGYTIFASGVDENGNQVNDYVLGKGGIEILDNNGMPTPNQQSHFVKLLSAQSDNLKEGDMFPTSSGYMIQQDGSAHPLGTPFDTISTYITNTLSGYATKEEILPVVESTYTKIQYTDGSISSFNFTGMLRTSDIPNIQNAKRIDIGQGVTQLEAFLFEGISSLTGVTFPSTLDEISKGAFNYTGLVSAFIPSTVTYIDDYAFEADTLSNVTVEGKTHAEAETLLQWANIPPTCSISTYNIATQEWVEQRIAQLLSQL